MATVAKARCVSRRGAFWLLVSGSLGCRHATRFRRACGCQGEERALAETRDRAGAAKEEPGVWCRDQQGRSGEIKTGRGDRRGRVPHFGDRTLK